MFKDELIGKSHFWWSKASCTNDVVFIHCIVGNFGKEFNLVNWQGKKVNCQIKIAKFLS